MVEVVSAPRVSSVYTLAMSDTKWQDKFQYCGQGQDSLNSVAELSTKPPWAVIEQTGEREGKGSNITVRLVVEVVLALRVSSVYTLAMSDTKWQDKFQYCGQGQDSLNSVAEL